MTLDLRRWLYSVISALGAIPQKSQPTFAVFSRALETVLVLSLFAPLVVAQASPTAERQLNVQVGGMVSLANPGVPRDASVYYGRWNYSGGSIYATADPYRRFGLEVGARQLFGNFVIERTYLAGPRYYKPYGSYVPYAKVILGRGTLKFPDSILRRFQRNLPLGRAQVHSQRLAPPDAKYRTGSAPGGRLSGSFGGR
jgi:hypothetical protein